MTEKEKYIDEEISVRVQYWISKMLLLGIIYFPFIGIADYFLTPENLNRFSLYRAGVTIILAGAYYLNKVKRNITYQYILITASTILSALVIETMILQFGGHSSPYYAGLCLLIIAALGLIPYGFSLSLSVGIVIYMIYLLPIFFLDTITRPSVFIANNIFMICTFMLALTWRSLSQKIMISERALHYDLVKDKSKLEEALKALNKSELWHRSLFENATDGIIVLDRNGVIVNANRTACEMHGYGEGGLAGKRAGFLLARENADVIMTRIQRILAGESLVFETTHRRKDGAVFPVEVSSKAIMIENELFIQSFYRDISEKKRLQEHLLQSQKMESIGVLAGGIAHDFNNTLNIILGNTGILQSCEGLDARAIQSLRVIEDTSIKAGKMVSKLLGFARKSTYEFLPLNLNDVVHDTLKLLERVIDKTINLVIELDSRLPCIDGDINQIEQIIMNLIVNARDAIPDKKGTITVRTAFRKITKEMRDVPPFVPSGEYVLLTVIDTGLGIPEHMKSTIFEPFFTTKERGKGTGLGLSMVYGAVKEHRGYIDVHSSGKGSIFTVYLPAKHDDSGQRVEKCEAPVLRGNETILVVDDEESELSSMKEILSNRGYNAIAALDPEKSLELFRENPKQIELVIADIVMPRMDGRELIRQMRTIRPEIKVLAVSGYTDYAAEKEKLGAIEGFLRKPLEASSLLFTVRNILDSRTKNVFAA